MSCMTWYIWTTTLAINLPVPELVADGVEALREVRFQMAMATHFSKVRDGHMPVF